MGVTGLLKLKTLTQKQLFYKGNHQNYEFFCKALYMLTYQSRFLRICSNCEMFRKVLGFLRNSEKGGVGYIGERFNIFVIAEEK